MRRIAVGVLVMGLIAAGCSSGDAGPDATSTTRPVVHTQPKGTGVCDDIDPSTCLLPWPNDRFTRGDASTETGRRLDLPADGMPANAEGTRIGAAEWNRNDGFSPASTLLTHIDGLDVEASNLPPVTDIGASLRKDSPLVLIDTDTGKRVAAWAELDANASDPTKQALMIVPATSLVEGHHHVVGLRNLKGADGADLQPSRAFVRELSDPDPMAKATLSALGRSGVDLSDLDLAWSFTVGSGDSISGRLRKMWADTEAELGSGAPDFAVTSDEESGPARIVEGTFTMPKYLEGDGGPGSFMNNADSPDGIPSVDGTMDAKFFCTVPAEASGDDPAGIVIYGHGLLGSRAEARSIGTVGATVNLSFCALDYIGMSADDVGSVVDSFKDLTSFRSLPDRLQQGHLGFLLLGRLLRSSKGFVTDPAFQDASGAPVLDRTQVSLLGASQGGILGGVASSLTNDWKQVILAVPGIGYNLLLRRSVDFDEFFPAVEASYPDELDHPLLLDLLEQLWQRGENAGYAQHLVHHPYPGVKAKHVLLLEAFGDHQVANVSTEKLARTLGLGRRAPTLADGRSSDREPFWGIRPLGELPSNGSGLVVWDFGTPTPPTKNLPNRQGSDPHGKLADVPEALALVLSFVRDHQIIDVCGGEPCSSPG